MTAGPGVNSTPAYAHAWGLMVARVEYCLLSAPKTHQRPDPPTPVRTSRLRREQSGDRCHGRPRPQRSRDSDRRRVALVLKARIPGMASVAPYPSRSQPNQPWEAAK